MNDDVIYMWSKCCYTWTKCFRGKSREKTHWTLIFSVETEINGCLEERMYPFRFSSPIHFVDMNHITDYVIHSSLIR